MLKDVILAYLPTDLWPVGYRATSINAKVTIKDKEKPGERIIKCRYFCMGPIGPHVTSIVCFFSLPLNINVTTFVS